VKGGQPDAEWEEELHQSVVNLDRLLSDEHAYLEKSAGWFAMLESASADKEVKLKASASSSSGPWFSMGHIHVDISPRE
jgi:hypothetical protein